MYKCIDNSSGTVSGMDRSNVRVAVSNPVKQVHPLLHWRLYSEKDDVRKITQNLQLSTLDTNIIK